MMMLDAFSILEEQLQGLINVNGTELVGYEDTAAAVLQDRRVVLLVSTMTL
jgi:hypothetical protein